MTDELPASAADAFSAHDAFAAAEDGFEAETVAFDNRVTASETDDWALAYAVTVRVPTLSATTDDEVGSAVEDGWFDTFRRRLEDAPKATRANVDLDTRRVERVGDEVVVEFRFTFGDADHAADVAKAFVEYVEGTYVEGVVPGYDYEPPVSTLLENAASEGGERGGTPL